MVKYFLAALAAVCGIGVLLSWVERRKNDKEIWEDEASMAGDGGGMRLAEAK